MRYHGTSKEVMMRFPTITLKLEIESESLIDIHTCRHQKFLAASGHSFNRIIFLKVPRVAPPQGFIPL